MDVDGRFFLLSSLYISTMDVGGFFSFKSIYINNQKKKKREGTTNFLVHKYKTIHDRR